jgi:uncharacterized membrane protein
VTAGRGWLGGLRALMVTAGLLPWLFALARSRPAGAVASFALLCHQKPERTLAIAGVPMLVCSRCAGLYLGAALGAIAPLSARLLPHGRALVLGAIALAVIDVVTQDAGLHPPWHPSRLATGLLMGWTASAFMMASLARGRARAPADQK